MAALVTGGGRGIGQAIAVRLAQEGWRVAVAARSLDQLEETVQRCQGQAIAAPVDVGDAASIQAMVDRVLQVFGEITLLVNNAATGGPFGPFAENDAAEWWRCQEVNVRGPMLCCRHVLPGMIERRRGRIINVASGAGTQAFADMSAYVVSKTALIRFSEQLAEEVRAHGVSVFSIHPGTVLTAMLEEARHKHALLQSLVDSGQTVPPEKAADLVAFLASGKGDSLSGSYFSVDDPADVAVEKAQPRRLRLE